MYDFDNSCRICCLIFLVLGLILLLTFFIVVRTNTASTHEVSTTEFVFFCLVIFLLGYKFYF